MKLTQKEVAEKSGLSVFTISSFENGSSTGITLGYKFVSGNWSVEKLK